MSDQEREIMRTLHSVYEGGAGVAPEKSPVCTPDGGHVGVDDWIQPFIQAQSPGARSLALRVEVIRGAFPRGDDQDLIRQ